MNGPGKSIQSGRLGNHIEGFGTAHISRADLEAPSCPACYKPHPPTAPVGYCVRCLSTGAAQRHQRNRSAGW
jgi:hypothetical protein